MYKMLIITFAKPLQKNTAWNFPLHVADWQIGTIWKKIREKETSKFSLSLTLARER
jgi:hypothetical protein